MEVVETRIKSLGVLSDTWRVEEVKLLKDTKHPTGVVVYSFVYVFGFMKTRPYSSVLIKSSHDEVIEAKKGLETSDEQMDLNLLNFHELFNIYGRPFLFYN